MRTHSEGEWRGGTGGERRERRLLHCVSASRVTLPIRIPPPLLCASVLCVCVGRGKRGRAAQRDPRSRRRDCSPRPQVPECGIGVGV